MENSLDRSETILCDRYRLLRQLKSIGSSNGSRRLSRGIGSTYLVEDLHTCNQLCVLKELLPQIQDASILAQAQERLRVEADLLFQLQHPQIPKLREFLRCETEGKLSLFLVEEYFEGQTYHFFLNARKKQGLQFSEAEITELFRQLLPVLQYIHAMGVVHQDICPDNLLLRQTDGMPALINFGLISQVTEELVSEFTDTRKKRTTVFGRNGYAPQEQLQAGKVAPNSDLYALAVTALVLLSGKKPQHLIDLRTLEWNWKQQTNLSPKLRQILEQMLGEERSDRPQTATDVLSVFWEPLPGCVHVVRQHPQSKAAKPITEENWMPNSKFKLAFSLVGKITLGLTVVFGAASLGWFAGNAWLESNVRSQQLDKSDRETLENLPEKVSFPLRDDPEPKPATDLSVTERSRKEILRSRRINLAIEYDFFIGLVNEVYWEKYPEQEGRIPTNNPEDSQWRHRWDYQAQELLNMLADLSDEARRGLGSYTLADRQRWIQQANQERVSSRTLYDLADADFFEHFPEQEDKQFFDEPIGQVWSAIVFDQLKALQTTELLGELFFDGKTEENIARGTLEPGGGKVYIAQLEADRFLEISLESSDRALLSLYSPTGNVTLVEDSTENTWSGTLPETGYYEFVIVSRANKPLDFKLEISVSELATNTE
ncbi:serine/threonine protein kinase [Oscillatoria salina]|uniref:serine/threonine protein kinase n=1 Tax=Oscillatoria salina TaxID=331517 RepID=UPI001CCF8440|nr:serine/threonine-protein kinase [Oscillatoria salina]MBZ8181984.1 serine/threonine protein kinase [Oscillatoria salina IIICB1]